MLELVFYYFRRCRHLLLVHRYFRPDLRPYPLCNGIVHTINIYCANSSELKLVLVIYIIVHEESLDSMIIIEFNGVAGNPVRS